MVFCCFFFYGSQSKSYSCAKSEQRLKQKMMGQGPRQWEKAVRKTVKTACNQPLEIFETASKKWTRQTTFLIGWQNVNLSADVIFPVYTNFKGVPPVVMWLRSKIFIASIWHIKLKFCSSSTPFLIARMLFWTRTFSGKGEKNSLQCQRSLCVWTFAFAFVLRCVIIFYFK